MRHQSMSAVIGVMVVAGIFLRSQEGSAQQYFRPALPTAAMHQQHELMAWLLDVPMIAVDLRAADKALLSQWQIGTGTWKSEFGPDTARLMQLRRDVEARTATATTAADDARSAILAELRRWRLHRQYPYYRDEQHPDGSNRHGGVVVSHSMSVGLFGNKAIAGSKKEPNHVGGRTGADGPNGQLHSLPDSRIRDCTRGTMAW
jgi:hypothetical protein